MKAALVICFIALTSFCGFAQSLSAGDYIRKSKELISNGRYITAIEILEEVLVSDENNEEACYELGNALRLSFQYTRAEAFYRKVVYLNDKSYPLSVYYLALMAKYNGNYDESAVYFSQFIDQWSPTSKYPVFTEQAYIERACAEMASAHNDKSYFIEELPALNSEFNDYAPASDRSGRLIITSSRVTRQNKATDHRFGEALSEQYYYRSTDQGYEILADSIKRINTRYNDGSGCFSNDGREYYFTICGYKVDNCRIYVSSRLPDGSFSAPEALPEQINLPKSDNKQPGISGDTLYFVSDRKGGHGGNDIWYSVKQNSAWSKPVNLGSSINTPMNENTPRPVLSNLLLFSSDGHQGFGGMDIFLARRKSSGDTTLVNIGIPFNSSRDDMFPDIHQDYFFWSSNKSGGIGGFDIYRTEIESVLHFTSLVSVVNIDARRSSALPPPHELRDLGATYITIVNTGELSFEQLPPDQQQSIDALALGRDADMGTLTDLARAQIDLLVSERKAFFKENTREKIRVQLDPVEMAGSYRVLGKIKCQYCHAEPVVELLDSLGTPMHKAIPSGSGEFRFANLAAGQVVYVQVESHEGGVMSFTGVAAEFQPDHQTFTYIPVYFDLAESSLRPESAPVLEVVAKFLQDHPEIHLEIIAHADNTGSEAYNEILSQKRGETVLHALLDQRVNTTSIMVRARGYRDPTASNATPLGRQLNRRVEFRFTGPSFKIDDSYSYCFTRERISGYEFNEFLESNGLTQFNEAVNQETVRAFYPVLTKNQELMDNSVLTCSPNHPGK